jgi:hypothetical protein
MRNAGSGPTESNRTFASSAEIVSSHMVEVELKHAPPVLGGQRVYTMCLQRVHIMRSAHPSLGLASSKAAAASVSKSARSSPPPLPDGRLSRPAADPLSLPLAAAGPCRPAAVCPTAMTHPLVVSAMPCHSHFAMLSMLWWAQILASLRAGH